MKRKLLSFLLIGILIIGLTGCRNNTQDNKDSETVKNSATEKAKTKADDGVDLVKKYTEYVSSGDVDSAVSLLDLDLLLDNTNMKGKWTGKEVKEALGYFKDANIKFSNIYKESSDEKEKILKDIAGEYSYQAYMDKYSKYDFYIADYSLTDDSGKTVNKKDIFYVENENGNLKIVNSMTTESIITMYYIKVYSNNE